MPKISVIIPVYNSSKTIGQCLNSIFDQTFKDVEVIVVNDGSTDKSLAILEKFDDRIILLNQENRGAPIARNNGFEKSRGEYVIFCDADVIMKSEMLETMLGVLEAGQEYAYVYSSFKFGFKKFKSIFFSDEKLRQMPYIHTTSLIRRSFFPSFDENLKKFQDWDLWLTILENGGRGLAINRVLFSVKSGGTMSSWLPSFAYKIPWLRGVKKYKEAEKVIKEKHNL